MTLFVTQRNSLWGLFWAFLGSLCHCFAFPPWNQFYLMYLTPFFFLLAIERFASIKQALITAAIVSLFTGYFAFNFISFVMQEFGHFHWTIGFLFQTGFGLICEPHFYLFFVAGFLLKNEINKLNIFLRLLLWTSLYLSIEFILRDFKIFPDMFGHSQYTWLPIYQLAAYGGLTLVAVPICLIGTSLYLFKEKYNFYPLLVSIAILLIAFFVGSSRVNYLNHEMESSEKIKVALIQANIGNADKSMAEHGSREGLQKVINSYYKPTITAAKDKPDLIIWPETAYPLSFPSGPDYIVYSSWSSYNAQKIKELTAKYKVPLLLGGYESLPVGSQKSDYNSAILINHEGKVLTSYKKNHLLIFGEYMPFSDWFPSLKKLNPQMGNFGQGKGAYPIDWTKEDGKKIKLGINICYEALMAGFMRDLANNDSDIFINLTNDSWFGPTNEPWQHLALTTARSVEYGLPMIRATNTGISVFIHPTGEIVKQGPLFSKAIIRHDIAARSFPTLYRKIGDLFAWILVLLSLAFAFHCYRLKAKE